jgi:hypothetical protein
MRGFREAYERTVGRTLLGLVGLLGLLGGVSGCRPAAAGGSPSDAWLGSPAGAWIEVSPGTIAAGLRVTVRADCGDNSPATVTSRAFGTATLRPWSTRLSAEVQVAPNVKDGGYEVTLTCQSGQTAKTTLWVVTRQTPPTVGPNTGGGFLAGNDHRLSAPVVWLAGGFGALIAAAVVGIASVRRQRRASWGSAIVRK